MRHRFSLAALYVSSSPRPPWYATPKRPILGCITFRKCAIPGVWLVFHSSSAEILILVHEPPLLSGWFIDSMLIKAWSPLWNCAGTLVQEVSSLTWWMCLWVGIRLRLPGSWWIDSPLASLFRGEKGFRRFYPSCDQCDLNSSYVEYVTFKCDDPWKNIFHVIWAVNKWNL